MGRVYLPGDWLREAGIDREALRRAPTFTPALGGVVKRLLDAADVFYARSDLGIPELPADCRSAIRAARLIYSDIGRVIRRNGGNSVDTRAHTSALRKLYLLGVARFGRMRPVVESPAAAGEIRFLLDAVGATPT